MSWGSCHLPVNSPLPEKNIVFVKFVPSKHGVFLKGVEEEPLDF